MKPSGPFSTRTSGILLHPTSLPGPYGVGDLGPAAHRFAEWLGAAGQSFWQMLPVGPPGTANSPYDSPSSFAGSALLISLELLAQRGWLKKSEIVAAKPLGTRRADYAGAARFREPRLRQAFERFRAGAKAADREELARFRAEQSSWLRDYTLFSALKSAHGGACWSTWTPELRLRNAAALRRAGAELKDQVEYHEFLQFEFHRQWAELRERCQALGVRLLGDVPMFVAYDGADVWANPELFHLDDQGRRTVVAGVPPDAFSRTGQLWGNPLYRWDVARRTGYRWWIERFKTTLTRFDAARLDHFIGFRRYWEVPAKSKTAMRGRYVTAPGEDFFEKVRRALGGLPFMAEDLGIVTPEVTALRDRFELPGMCILQFAFSDPNGSDYLPHRFGRHSVVYSGTHDNDTTVGWFKSTAATGRGPRAAASRAERERVLAYAGSSGRSIHWDIIRLGLMSVANTAVFPLQDLLGLGSQARMNTPGTTQNNWQWRVRPGELTDDLSERMSSLARLYDRAPRQPAR